MHNPTAIKSIGIVSGLITGVFALFTAEQVGPFAPLIIALGFYVVLYFTIQGVLLGLGCALCAFRGRKNKKPADVLKQVEPQNA